MPPLHAEFRIYQDYVSVPALLTYYPSTKQRFFLSLGPEVGFLVAARSIIHYSSPSFPDASTDEKDGMEDINVTLDAAAGYESLPTPAQQESWGQLKPRYAPNGGTVSKGADTK